VLWVVFFAVLVGRVGRATISDFNNKVCSGCGIRRWRWLSSLSGRGGEGKSAPTDLLVPQPCGLVGLSLALASAAGGPSEQISSKLPRWEAAGDVAVGGGPLNKCQARSNSCVCKLGGLLLLLAGCGGEEKVAAAPVSCSVRSWRFRRSAGGLRPLLFLLTGCGGEGEGGSGFVACWLVVMAWGVSPHRGGTQATVVLCRHYPWSHD
jgi:hypothetical protein